MYLPEIGCLFIHIPKTAGNSIMEAFGVGWENHMDLALYREKLGTEAIANSFKFTIVRNPWDRLFSEYNFQWKKKQRADTVRLFLNRPDGTRRSFGEWAEYALSHAEEHSPKEWGGKTSPQIHRLSPQVDWIVLNGKIGVDFVGRIETIQPDFNTVCERLNIPPRRLPRRNRKLHFHYSRYYDAATRKLVDDYYRSDIEAFGYTFGK